MQRRWSPSVDFLHARCWLRCRPGDGPLQRKGRNRSFYVCCISVARAYVCCAAVAWYPPCVVPTGSTRSSAPAPIAADPVRAPVLSLRLQLAAPKSVQEAARALHMRSRLSAPASHSSPTQTTTQSGAHEPQMCVLWSRTTRLRRCPCSSALVHGVSAHIHMCMLARIVTHRAHVGSAAHPH